MVKDDEASSSLTKSSRLVVLDEACASSSRLVVLDQTFVRHAAVLDSTPCTPTHPPTHPPTHSPTHQPNVPQSSRGDVKARGRAASPYRFLDLDALDNLEILEDLDNCLGNLRNLHNPGLANPKP
jgi:hypothetical protein